MSVWPLLVLFALPLATNSAHIPETRAATLAGQPVDLPVILQNHTSVLIVGFSRSSREAVAAWAHRLQVDYRASESVQYLDLIILADIPRPLRPLVVSKIARDIPPIAQPHSFLIYDHEEDWKAVAGYDKQNGPDNAYLLLVDSAGALKGHLAVSTPNDQTYAELKHRIEQIER